MFNSIKNAIKLAIAKAKASYRIDCMVSDYRATGNYIDDQGVCHNDFTGIQAAQKRLEGLS